MEDRFAVWEQGEGNQGMRGCHEEHKKVIETGWQGQDKIPVHRC